MKALVLALRILMVLCLVVGAGVIVREGRVILEENRMMGANDALIDSLRMEKQKLRERTQEVGEEMAAMPDSMQSAKMGYAINSAKSIAKADMIYDSRITRARKLNHVHHATRRHAVNRLVWWQIPLAFVFLLSFFVHMVLRKRV